MSVISNSAWLARFADTAHPDCTLGEIADVLREQFGKYEEAKIS